MCQAASLAYNEETTSVRTEKPMTLTAEAVYENGMLRLTEALPLGEGTSVRVIVIPNGTARPALASPAETLAAIAALPLESGPAFSGRDHDRILYGDQGAR